MKLSLRGFMRFQDRSEVEFPRRGIVLVTGNNGQGKSSLIEGVSYVQFGKTVRGTSPWQKGFAGEVSLSDGDLEILRTHSAGDKNQVTFKVGEQSVEYENQTKAQEALSATVGDFDVWRRTCVFSSHDAAHFTLATDSERKRLLEAAVGLTVFDGALEACRSDLNVATNKQRAAAAQLAQLGERLAGAKLRLDDAVKVLQGAPPAVDIPGLEVKRTKADQLLMELEEDIRRARLPQVQAGQDVARLTAEIEAARRGLVREIEALQSNISAETRLQASAEQQAEQLKERIAGLQRSLALVEEGKCPTCGAPVKRPDIASQYSAEIRVFSDTLIKLSDRSSPLPEMQGRLTMLQRGVPEGAAKLHEQLEEAKVRAQSAGEVPQLEADKAELIQKRAGILAQLSSAMETSRRREQAEAAVAAAKQAVTESSKDLEAIGAEETASASRVALLEAVATVLGTRGVRAQVLSRSLSSMEAVANLWLSKVAGGGLKLRLKSFTEKKTGGVADAISLEVEGAGGGLGYKASSGGERRRLDIAITLALSEVAAAARGQAPGMIFLDELLDCLDAEGTAAALSAVRLLGETRCVVLITHSEEVLAQLTPTLRLRVGEGKVSVA